MNKRRRTLHGNHLSESAVFFIYLILFVLAEVISSLSTPFLLLIVLFNIWLSLTDKKKRDVVLFSTFILGSEAVALLNLFVFIFFCRNKLLCLLKMEKKTAISLGVVLAVSLLCGIFQNTLWNVLGYTAFLGILVAAGAATWGTVKPGRFAQLITRFVWIELVVTALIFLRCRSFDFVDAYYGTLKNSHIFGNWLILALCVLLSDACSVRPLCVQELFKTHGITIGAIVAMLWITDAKIPLLCALLGLAAYWALRYVKKYRLFIFVVGLYAAAFLVIVLLQTDPVRELAYKVSPGMAAYLYEPGWNGKFTYIHGTFFESLKGFRLLTGYGLGQYGSRVANAFAYDVMWRGDNFINNAVEALFAPHSVPEYTRYISYYTEEFVSQIWWRSAILSYPFNSFTAIIGETGLIGVFVLAYILDRLFGGKRYSYIIYYFLFVCVFDTYLDNVLCAGPAIMYLVNAGEVQQKRFSTRVKRRKRTE